MIRILSCNLFFGRADPSALLEIIEEHSVDLVCAQELSPALAAALSAALPHGDLGHDQVSGGNGIASRQPVGMGRIALPRRDAWVATLDPAHWPALPTAVQIVNVHISAPHLWPYFPMKVRRSHQLRALLAERALVDGLPHAIVGDFNASPAWPVYRKMCERYTDGAVQAANGKLPASTWPSLPKLGIDGFFRIDHCFVSGLQSTAVRTVAIRGSDHRGLLIDLRTPA